MKIFLLDIILFVPCSSYLLKNHQFFNTKTFLSEIEEIEIIKNKNNMFLKQDYHTALNNLLHNKISKIYVNEDYKSMVTIDNSLPHLTYQDYHLINTNELLISNIITKSEIPIHFINFTPTYISNIQHFLSTIITASGYIIPLYILYYFISFLGKNINNKFFENTNVIQVLQNVSLSSWAGSPEVLEECKEVISYLENKETFLKLGAEMPRGILLEGPPGTGKTLLAKGIAAETNASFIAVSGSEFMELFVGLGASRVRDLFKSARENTPSVIFIDEIDAIGRQRGTSISNDEREQTLNQLLYEMDGFNDNDGILIIAATNRKDILDEALLRPGRFDRIIRVPLPDKFSREQILKYYLNLRPIEKTFNVSTFAEITEGFSGAQLKNLINEAAILSAKKNATMILESDLFRSFEKSVIGLVKTSSNMSVKTKKRVAIHEAGHAFLTLMCSEYFELQKVSIQETYNGAGGYTLFTENPELDGLYTKDILKKKLIILLGGKAAENVFYGEDFVSLGSIEDLKQANQLARQMISNFGMGESLEVFYNENIDEQPFLGKSLSIDNKYSDHRRSQIDSESLALIIEAYTEAKNIIFKYTNNVSKLTDLLIAKTLLNQEDIDLYKDLIIIEL